MPQNDRPLACPRCEEPPEPGDLFCGACGTDLRPAMPTTPPAPAAGTRPDAADATGTPGTRALRPTAPGAPASPAPAAPAPAAGAPTARPAPDGTDETPATPTPPPTPQPAGASPAASGTRPGCEEAQGGTPVSEGLRGSPARGPGGSPQEKREGEGRRSNPSPAAPSAPAADDAPSPTDAPAATDRLGDGSGAAHETPPTRDDAPAGNAPCVACGTGAVADDGHCTHCGHKQPLARDHWERELRGVAGASDRGLRHRRNEDFFSVAAAETPGGEPAGIAVVCDGVSSARRSDEASEAAAEAAGASMREAIPRGVHAQQAMHDALVAAAGAVDALATDEEREAQRNAPACTIVGTVVSAGILTVGWVGDSRAYWVPDDRDARPARLTEDDSWAAQMVAAGLMSEAQAYADARAHAITGWLGADAYELDPHTASFKPDRPGVVIVCTDGLWNYAESAEQMAAAVPPDAADRPLAAARHLVGFALDGGGHDNVTVAVVPFTTPSETEPAA